MNLKAVHTSDRNTFKQCRQKWDFSSPLRQNLEPLRISQALRFGTGMHSGLEGWYNPQLWDNEKHKGNILLAIEAFETAYPKPEDATEEEVAEWEAERLLGIAMLENYAKWAPTVDHFKPLYTEIPFEVPIGEVLQGQFVKRDGSVSPEWRELPAVYAGKIDLIVENLNDGSLWVYDHKTTATLSNLDWLAFDEQISSYCWAIQEMLGIKISGFIYNELLKTAPKPPKVLANGKLSIDKRQNTTFELFLASIRAGDYDVAPYLDILDYLRESGNKFFRRTQINRSPRELQLLSKRIALESSEMLREDLPIYPTPSKWNCSYCDFKSPCLSTLDGSNFEPIMSEMYKVRDSD